MTNKEKAENGRRPDGTFAPGHVGPGRPRGVPNKLSSSVKENIAQAFDEMGGIEELVAWAKKNDRNKAIFYQIYAKLLPHDMTLSGADATDGKLILEVVHVKGAEVTGGNGDGNGGNPEK